LGQLCGQLGVARLRRGAVAGPGFQCRVKGVGRELRVGRDDGAGPWHAGFHPALDRYVRAAAVHVRAVEQRPPVP